jgi:hypothetical protein
MNSIKTTITILLLALPVFLHGQASEHQAPAPKHEIGTDITALIQRLFNFNRSDIDPFFSAAYQITYKRHFGNFSFRTGIGGSTFSSDIENNFSEETLKRTGQSIDYRLGIEKGMEIGTRWNFYYGLDFVHSISNSRNDSNFQSGGWRHGSVRKGSTLGVSPLLGLEFKISERIALQTEANFIAFFRKITNQPKITQITDAPSQPMPSTDLETTKYSGTSFSVPNFLVLTVRL